VTVERGYVNRQLPASIGRRGGALTRLVGRLILRALGWRVEGNLPDRTKLVAVVAPHSSNWDFLVGIGLVFAWNLRVRYIGKKELFRFPLGPLMYWLGGIAVDRKAPTGLIDQVVDEFDRSPQILLGITPEGTRTPGARWKAGFYWIARRSGAAILPVYLDWGRKVIGIWPAFDPTESPQEDLAYLVAKYALIPRRDGTFLDPDRALPDLG